MKTSAALLLKTCKYCLTEFTPDKRHPNAQRCSSKTCAQAYKNEWGRANPECKIKWILNNPEKRKVSSSAYMKRNKPYYAAYQAVRTRHLMQAWPKWVEMDELEDIYKEAKYMQLEVDHIIPLKNKSICGLHVPWNLQLLTRSQNAVKSNKYDEDLVCLVETKNEG